MGKNFLLIRSNLRKTKGQTASILALILLSAFMLNIWLMLAMDYKQNFDRYHNRLNAEHVAFAINGDSDKMKPFLSETLEKDKRTDSFFIDRCLFMVGSFDYNGGEVNMEFIILEKQAALTRPIGKTELIENSQYTSGIYLPMIYKTGDIDIGKPIDIMIGNQTINYTVCGFFNNLMAGSHNCGMCTLLLTEDKYQELKSIGCAPEAAFVSVKINDKTEGEDFEATLKNALSAKYPNARMRSTSYSLVSSSRYISQMICSAVVSAMAFFVLLIALVVIASGIINYIQENMEKLGALKAIGYTSRQLTCSLLFQFSSIALIASSVGAALSYCLFPAINDMMISQTGIPYKICFLPAPFFITLAIIIGTVAFAVWLPSRKIRDIDPVAALRGGIQTHNFKRNHIPLEGTQIPLQPALALKASLSGIRQNIIVCITMLVLSLIVVFSALMVKNVIFDITPFLNLIVGETADSCINITADAEDRFLKDMAKDKRIEKIYLYNSLEINHIGGTSLTATLCDDFSKVNNQMVCFKGRFPKYDNEIAIAAKYAKENNLEIGDEIALSVGGRQAGYLISGFTQITNNLGKDCLLTREGYQRLGTLQSLSYYLNLADDVDIDAFNTEINDQFHNAVNTVLNITSVIKGAIKVYVSLMAAIVAVILVLSILIVIFVLYLLVKTMLNNRKRDYGILKALGFTTRQLILQTALSFMPAVVLSSIAGLILCSFIINPLVALFLNSIGIVKCSFTVPVFLITVAGAGLILLSFAIICLLSLRIKKISPLTLLKGE